MRKCIHTCIHAYMHTCIHADRHTHTYLSLSLINRYVCVSTPSTPPRESTECDPSKSTPDRSPVRPSGPSRQGTPMRTRPMRPHSRLRCAFVQHARRRPLTAPARPPTPLRVRRQRTRVLRVPFRAPCRAGYRSGYRATWGPAPASDASLLGGGRPCRVHSGVSAGRALCVLLRYSGISCKYSQYRE